MEFTICDVARTKTEKPVRSLFKMHAHSVYEIFFFISGDAEYFVEGTRYRLQPGDIMLMRKSESHHLILNSEAPYERIVLNFDLPFLNELDPDDRLMVMFHDRPLGKFNHYSAVQFPDNHWLFYLNKMIVHKDPMVRLAYLLPLLAELSECFETVKNTRQQAVLEPVASIVRFINHNLASGLSLSGLCEEFYLSKVHLNRLFKETTGTTVWNYITVKRLLMAREMLYAGKTPTEVYAECGFQDYTTFFRAYKKKFGVSPKNDQSR